MVGVSQFTGAADLSVPIYSASLLWQATPKLSFGLATGRTAGAPTSVVANAQTSETQSLTTSYQLTPKISLAAGIAYGQSAASGPISLGSNQPATLGNQAETSVTAFGRANYQMTPFLNATASYQYSDQPSWVLRYGKISSWLVFPIGRSKVAI